VATLEEYYKKEKKRTHNGQLLHHLMRGDAELGGCLE
jgi:hypothetical protein